MFCTNCGAKIADDLKFCTSCGTPMPTAKPADPPAGAATSAPQVPAAAATGTRDQLAPPTVAPQAPPLIQVEAKPQSKAEEPRPVPTQQVRSRPEPTVEREPLGASLAEQAPSGSKALPLLVVAILIIAAAASYFYFSSSSTQEASAPASQAPDTASAQPATATPSTTPPTSPPIEEARNQTQPTAEEAPAAAPDVVRSAGVEALIKAATSDDASQLEALIRELESEPAPAVGNRGEARRIAYRALPLLRAEKYDEAIPILEEARRADESDVEVVGNLADTLMRAGRLDEAWQMALEALRLAPRRTVGWSTIGMLSAKRDDAPGAMACLLTAYRFSNAQPTTLKVYSKLATTDDDPKVRAAMEGAITRIRESY